MPPIDPPPVTASGLLVAVETGEELLASIRSGFIRELERNSEAAAELDGSPSPPADSAAFTTTYTQEASVDEHDVVKYDGRHLYVAPSRGMSCCFILEPELSLIDDIAPVPSEPDPGSRSIRILATDPETARASQVGSLELGDDMTVEGLYVEDDRLAVITSTAWWGYYGVDFARPQSWTEQSTGFRIYDVSAPQAPAKQWEIRIEGGFVTSRRAGNLIYLITRYTPAVDGLDFYPIDEASSARNVSLLESLTLEDVSPRLQVNGQDSALIVPSDCIIEDASHELAPQQRGYPVLTTIIAIDLSNPGITDTLCYNGEASGTYVSPNAIYLTQPDYTPAEGPRTIVHRIDYREALQYRGSGKVKGGLQVGANPDFRISEAGENLRLVTTLWTGSQLDTIEHFLHVLLPAADALALDPIATLPSAARPDPIGKPNEDLYGVRFFGDRAYLVTFERTDPLYVIDLSDHRDPRIAGELEVTGFSDFLHPVSDDLLLGLGQDQNGRVKLELFDISSPSHPASRGALVLSEDAQWTYSDARYDRHAFTYLANAAGIDRFTVPVNAGVYDEASGYYSSEQRLHLLEIHGENEPGTASLVDVGYISATPLPQRYYPNNRNRAVIHDEAVFFIHGEYVWSALWSNPFNAQGPQ